MNPLILILTHLAAMVVSSAVTYHVMVRYLRVRDVDGHKLLEFTPESPDDRGAP